MQKQRKKKKRKNKRKKMDEKSSNPASSNSTTPKNSIVKPTESTVQKGKNKKKQKINPSDYLLQSEL